MLGGKDQSTHTAKSGILPGAGDLDLKHAGQVSRAGEHLFASGLVHRERFAGDVGLIDGALALDDFPVSRDVVAWANPDHVADL